MIIECHGHYTTTPAAHQAFRDAQLARLDDPRLPEPAAADISDDAIRESIESNQLKLLRERGGDLMLFSPRAAGMEHHVPDPATSRVWAQACNDLVHRVVGLYPRHFAGVCQLPQTPGGALDDSISELRRGEPAVERGELRLPEAGELRRLGRVVPVAVDDHRSGSCST